MFIGTPRYPLSDSRRAIDSSSSHLGVNPGYAVTRPFQFSESFGLCPVLPSRFIGKKIGNSSQGTWANSPDLIMT
jgi:hypothetical protein